MYRIAIISLLLILVCAPTVKAQDDSFYTWEPYDFSISLPESWTAIEAHERLYLGLPDDVNAAIAGEGVTGMVVHVTVIPAGLLPSELMNTALTGRTRDFEGWVDVAHGDTIYPTANIAAHDRVGRLVIVAQTYVVVGSFPEGTAADSGLIFEEMIATIVAEPVASTAEDYAEFTFEWHGLQLRVPRNWEMGNVTDPNLLFMTTLENRRQIAATFSQQDLILLIRDVSLVQILLSLDDVGNIGIFYYVPEMLEFEPIESRKIGEFEASQVNFRDDNTSGQAILLMRPGNAFLVVGMAGHEQWQASEQALFETIVDSIRFNP